MLCLVDMVWYERDGTGGRERCGAGRDGVGGDDDGLL